MLGLLLDLPALRSSEYVPIRFLALHADSVLARLLAVGLTSGLGHCIETVPTAAFDSAAPVIELWDGERE